MENKYKADIAIIGGGASGLAAAVSAAENCSKARIVIAERLDKTGRKILVTGNGRCNLGNKNISAENYHGSVPAMDIISNTPDAESFFNKLGVLCFSDEQGRIYPRSSSAATVLTALRLRTAAFGIQEICGFEVDSIEKSDGYILHSEIGEIFCRSVIIAAGGYAAPSLGTDGSMMRILRSNGYKTGKICPAIAPMKAKTAELKGLKGVRLKGNISAVSDGRILRTETGEIQFTESTISGICVFNLAYIMADYENKLVLRADLLPDMNLRELSAYLSAIRVQRGKCTFEELLTGIFAKAPAVYLVKRALGKPLSGKISELSDNELNKIADIIKSLEFKISGSSPWQNAQATFGGIHKDSIDKNLQSRIHPGIFFAGEILDTVGDCGGYNLQWAWSSGIIAGKSSAEFLKAGGGI